MARKLIICAAVAALALAAPAWAASPLDEYQQTGHITPCRYSSGQLQGSVPNDVAQYAPEYESQLQAAARQRASGCGSSGGGGGSAGRGTTPGGSGGGGSGSDSAATGAGAGTVATAAASARRTRARARARRRARGRAQGRLATAIVSPADISSDARVPDRALVLAALPVLLLLALVGGFRIWDEVGRRRVSPSGPARTPTGAIILPPPEIPARNGNGVISGNGASGAPAAEAPTQEVASLEPSSAGD
jgi:hypothetical protein